MSKVKRFMIIIMIFMIVFEPPLLSFNLIHIIGFISIIYLTINIKNTIQLLKKSKILYIEIILLVFGMVLTFAAMGNNNSPNGSLSYLYWFFYTIPFSMMIYILMTNNNEKPLWLIENVIYAGLIQSVLAIIAFINPTVKSFFIEMLVNYGYGEVIYELDGTRLFGLASELTFTTPAVLSVLSVISIYLAYKGKKIFYLFAPILFFSGIINARNSLIIFGLGILILLIYIAKENIVKMILVVMVCSLLLFSLYSLSTPFLKTQFPGTYDWITDGIKEIRSFLGGNINQGYFSYILRKDKYTMPDNLFNLIFGTGIYVLNPNKYGFNTDIGFVNDIWLGGLLYSINLHVFFILLVARILKKNNKEFTNHMIIFLVLSIYILNFKGHAFSKNNITTLFWIIIVPIISAGGRKNEFNI